MPPREAKRGGQAMAREKIQKPGEEEYDMGGLVMVVLILPPPHSPYLILNKRWVGPMKGGQPCIREAFPQCIK